MPITQSGNLSNSGWQFIETKVAKNRTEGGKKSNNAMSQVKNYIL